MVLTFARPAVKPAASCQEYAGFAPTKIKVPTLPAFMSLTSCTKFASTPARALLRAAQLIVEPPAPTALLIAFTMI